MEASRPYRQGVYMLFDERKSEKIAQDLLGMEFEMGGRGENKKIDCYGVLIYYFSKFGIKLPDYSYLDDWDDKEEYYLKEYSSMFRKLEDHEEPQCGDVILFKNMVESANHAGVYLGNNKFIHAYQKIGTKIDSLTHPVWKKKIYGFFRLK